ncbi:TetR/AcrR family transcriptional regulator [uncultured Lactobacillus sp.]|uniref:TetR/AcrR family transcriptional regulator n=1 Tax=uncultured Lactobacillus sp. TaxID=153152 RepID=UPI00260BC266|nr:TetR/AcrR family transcriptional regulator [uncultured Lactobacillus sp.]
MGKREENAKATKKSIMRATSELIAEKGYENVVVEDITKRAGIAKGTFYNYYKQKDDVITEFSNSYFSKIEDRAFNIENFDSPIDGLSYYLESSMEIIFESGISRTRKWINYISLPSSIPKKFTFDLVTVTKILRIFVEKGCLETDTPVEQIADRIMTYCYGVIFTWTINEQENPLQKIKSFNKNILPHILNQYIVKK